MPEDILHFPVTSIAMKMAVSIGIGMLIGLEREWSSKDAGVRTFAIVALMGGLAAVVGPNFEVMGFVILDRIFQFSDLFLGR
jgi:uncharacterized membrane protein YhiD involved in acid resistance